MKFFTEHPKSVDETYFQHMKVAGCFGLTLMLAGMCAIIHAILPPFFKFTASTTVFRLNDKHRNRRALFDKADSKDH